MNITAELQVICSVSVEGQKRTDERASAPLEVDDLPIVIGYWFF